MNTDRREFMKIMGLIGLTGHASRGFSLAGGAEDTPRAPEKTGRLTPVEKADLTEVFAAIDSIWALGGHCSLDAAGFGGVLDAKTGRAPSYLTEYRTARAIYLPLREARGVDAACRALYLGGEAPEPVERFVLAEFIELTLAFGGFRAFGFANAAGHPGGGFSDPARPPYRTLEKR